MWISNLNNLLTLLRKWNALLKCWKRISTVMRHSYQKIRKEFEEFRTVSKYFRRMAGFVDEERFVIKLIEGKHIACWLTLADKHLGRVVEVSMFYCCKWIWFLGAGYLLAQFAILVAAYVFDSEQRYYEIIVYDRCRRRVSFLGC